MLPRENAIIINMGEVCESTSKLGRVVTTDRNEPCKVARRRDLEGSRQ